MDEYITDPISFIVAQKRIISELGRDLFWRGHADCSWSLRPSVYRDGVLDSENNLASHFYQRAPSRMTNPPASNESQAWLFLMQHHGLPTRLLDWSNSPLTALYFVVHSNPNSDGELIALNPFELNSFYFSERAILSDHSKDVAPLFNKPLTKNAENLEKVAAISSIERNQRMLMQSSRFTIHGVRSALKEITQLSPYIKTVKIRKEDKELFKHWLYDLGVRRSNLFPDLDNLAAELTSLTTAHE